MGSLGWQEGYRIFKPKIRTFARKAVWGLPGMDVEDIEQELRLVLWKVLDRHDANKGAGLNSFVQECFKKRITSLVRAATAQKRRYEFWETLSPADLTLALDLWMAEPGADIELELIKKVVTNAGRNHPASRRQGKAVS